MTYAQYIADDLMKRIDRDELYGWLSTKSLASDYSVSRNTMRNAYRILETKGYVRMHGCRGTWVKWRRP